VPSEPESPGEAYERAEVRDRVRAAVMALPPRERKVIGLYYYRDVTMKQIGAEIGVNESRVSQLHARAIKRLRTALGPDVAPAEAAGILRGAVLAFQQRPKMLKVQLDPQRPAAVAQHVAPKPQTPAVVVSYAKASRLKSVRPGLAVRQRPHVPHVARAAHAAAR
jgi:RNA polymerase sigma factor for flagellar operon FliA